MHVIRDGVRGSRFQGPVKRRTENVGKVKYGTFFDETLCRAYTINIYILYNPAVAVSNSPDFRDALFSSV